MGMPAKDRARLREKATPGATIPGRMEIPRWLSHVGRRLSGPTGIYSLMEDLGQALERGSPETIMMGGGNPGHVPAAEAVWRRRLGEMLAEPGLVEATLGDYDGPQGRRRFLVAVAEFFRRQCGWDIGPEHVTVTTGSQTGSFMLLNLIAGDDRDTGRQRRVLFPIVPEYIGYADQIICEDGLVGRRPLIEERGPHRFKYHVDFGGLSLDDDLAAVCLSRPTNPSTNVVAHDELERLSEEARRVGALLIVDNAYGLPIPGIVFPPTPMPAWRDHMVMTFSLSKLGLPATRTGIVIGAPELVRRLAAMTAVVGLANPSIGQAIVEPLLRSDEILGLCRDHIRPFYAARCQQTLEWIDELMGSDVAYAVHEPEGAFFLWLWLPRLSISDRELYARLKARGVLVVPGSYFFAGLDQEWTHARQCLRISYGQPPERVRRGIELLAEEARKAQRV